MSKKLVTVGKWVAVRKNPEDEVTEGGIILAQGASIGKPESGVLVSAGDQKNMKDGETVLFAKGAGVEILFEGEKLHILAAEQIVGVVRDEAVVQ